MTQREDSREIYLNFLLIRWHLVPVLLVVLAAMVLWNPKSKLSDISKQNQIETQTKPAPNKNPDNKFITSYISEPPIVRWTESAKGSLVSTILFCNRRNITCKYYPYSILIPPNITGAYFFYASRIKIDKWPLPRYPNKIIWGLFHEESSKNMDILLHERALKLFNYSSTFSRYSDVPFPLFYAESQEKIISTKYFIKTSVKNSLLTEISPILFLQSICITYTDRDLYVQDLMKYQRIDSYGKCLNNKKMPIELKHKYLRKLYSDDFFRFVARYKFVIAIENGVCDDYVSEKFWRAIHLGVVPIYFGSPTIRDWLPNEKSAILIEDFPTPKLLSAHIDDLMRNDNLYEEYLEHKTKGLIRNQKIINEINERPYQVDYGLLDHEFKCFLCAKLHQMNETEPYRVINKQHYNCPPSKSALTQKASTSNIGHHTFKQSKPIVEKLYNDIKKSFK